MVGNDILKIERGRGGSGLAGVTTMRARVMNTALRVTMMLALLLTMPSAALAQSATTTYKVTLKEGTKDADNWKAKAGEGELKGLPLEGVAEGEKVTLQYEGRKRVMSVRATKKAAAWDGDLSKLTGKEPEGFATATDGMTITGTLAANVKVTIADRAKVTLSEATIEGTSVNQAAYKHAGITCLGNATIVLVGTNKVTGFYDEYPGIHVPVYKTLTIRGDGSLDAQSNGYGAGIGGGRGNSGGNITIEGGTIKATGGNAAAGIGGGFGYWCGNILIKGGSVEAKGGEGAAGIGGGFNGSCGDITITSSVTKVTATKGYSAQYSIGKGNGDKANCGAVTVGCTLGTDGNPVDGTGKEGMVETSPYTYWGVVVPLTMEALTNGKIKVVVDENNPYKKVPTEGMQYAVNDGGKNLIYTTTEIVVKKGDRVTFYGNDTNTDCYYGTEISGGEAEVMVYGNIMSLVDETGFASAITLSQELAFSGLFYKNTKLKDASGLLLPAKTLTNYCYYGMFRGCSALKAAPELPATKLAKGCYNQMFSSCKNLASVTCLATSGFDAMDCLYDWLDGAGSEAATTPTLYVDPSMTEASWNNFIFTVTPIGQ